MTLPNYLRIFRERWRLVVLIVALAVGISTLITSLTPKAYQASAQVFASANTDLTANSSQYDQQAAIQAQVATFAELVDTPAILDAVRRDLNLTLTNSMLASKISASASDKETLVLISVTDGSPSQAAAIANSAARAFVTVIERYKTPTDSRKSAVRLFITKPATAPDAPTAPRPVLNVGVGLLLGLLLGVALAVARDALDNRIKDVERLAKVANKPAMGVIVDDPAAARHPLATRAGTRNVRAENFRQLRANLQFANVDRHPRVIAVTSSVPSEGKTMVSLNLASTLAEAGFTVCLIDADLRRPTVAKVLGLPGPVGLTSVLLQQVKLDEALQQAGSNLFVLTSGPTPPNPSEVLASSSVRDVVRSLLERVDYVIIDTAPLLPVADGSEVASFADGALLVASYSRTTEVQVERSARSLSRVNAMLIGVVLNRVPSRRSEYGYTYYRPRQQVSSPPKNVGASDAERLPVGKG